MAEAIPEPAQADPAQAQVPVDPVDVRVYVVTGKHGIFTVPESYCRECNMFTRAVEQAVDLVDVPVRVRVLSWWGRMLGALFHGGYHAPVLVIDGERICQGYDVPTPERVAQAIEDAAQPS